ncbi:MAG: beta-ketoacyl-ACP synthase III [Andreesenia angusta]|nr:beta-ketoacyl-ACP synthase III [Andreesenia angusta]
MKTNNNIGIIGTGSYLPKKIMTNYDLEKIVDTSDEWIYTRTGIKERRIAEGESTSDLAFKAGLKAIESAGIDRDEIDMIIVATMSPDQPTPATACLVQKKLGCRQIPSFDISAACSGFIYGLSMAYAYISSGLCKKILLIGAEKMSSIIDWEDRSTCVLFGDGAGAVVVGEVDNEGILGFSLGSDGSGAEKLIVPSGGSVLPITKERLEKRENYIKMNGSDIFKFAVKKLPEIANNILKELDMRTEELDYMIPHQANIRIIDSANKKLKLGKEKILVNLNKYGNMSAASIPVALDESIDSKKIKKNDTILLIGFGGGLTWGTSVLKSSI